MYFHLLSRCALFLCPFDGVINKSVKSKFYRKNERVAHCGYFDISEMYKPVHLILSDRHILSSTQNNVRGLILNPYFDMMPWRMFCFLCNSFVLLK